MIAHAFNYAPLRAFVHLGWMSYATSRSFPNHRHSSINCGIKMSTPNQIEDWRRDLKVKITLALVMKLLGLILLWWLFFRGHAQ
jgi:hypothetical protein